MNRTQESVALEDVTVELSQEECWHMSGDPVQRADAGDLQPPRLRGRADLATASAFLKAELIFTLAQGEDPWPLEKGKKCLSGNVPVLEDCQPDELLEKSLENQRRHLWQVFFDKSLTEEQETFVKLCNSDRDILPIKMRPRLCGPAGPVSWSLSPLASCFHCSRKKVGDPNFTEKWLHSIKDCRTNFGEKYFHHSKNMKALGPEVETIQCLMTPNLEQVLKYNVSEIALLNKYSITASPSTWEESVFTVSQKSHGDNKGENKDYFELNGDENGFSRTAHKVDKGEESVSQKSNLGEEQKIDLERKYCEHGKNSNHNSVIVYQRTHPTDKNCIETST